MRIVLQPASAWFLKLFLCGRLYARGMCVSALRLLITSSVIWTPYDWLNKFYSFYVVAVSLLVMGVVLELKHIVETNIVRLSYLCTNHYLTFKVV